APRVPGGSCAALSRAHGRAGNQARHGRCGRSRPARYRHARRRDARTRCNRTRERAMTLSPDEIVYFHLGPLAVNATLVFTWVVMALLVGVSALVRRGLRSSGRPAAGQNALEALVEFVLGQIRD